MGDLALCDLGLKEVPLDTATLRGPHVHTLNLSGNALVAPGNLHHFTAVTTLILDHNDLESLEGFPRMPSVTTLWLNNNKVSQLVELADSLAASFPNLVYLAFMRNPASPPLICLSEEDTAASHRYRLYMLFRLPRLQFLDASAPTPAERAEAAEKGQYMAVRKPKRALSSGSVVSSAESPSGLASPSIFSGFGGAAADTGAASVAAAPGGGSGSGGAGAATSPSTEGRRPGAHIMLSTATSAYDGRHSEGNRFIRDSQL